MKLRKPVVFSDVNTKETVKSGKIAMEVNNEIMPACARLTTNAVFLLHKEKENVLSFLSFKGIKLLEYTIEIVERYLKKITSFVNLTEFEFGFGQKREAADDLFWAQKNKKIINIRKACTCVFLI